MRKIRAALLAAIMGVAATACASTLDPVTPDYERVDLPATETVVTAELGDTVLEKADIYTYDGIVLHSEISRGDGLLLTKFNIPPQELKARQEDDKWVYYYADNMTQYDAILGTSQVSGGIRISKDTGKPQLFVQAGRNGFDIKPPPEISRKKVIAVDRPNFKQELIYNGRVDDFVKFLYREFSADYARPAFNQEVQYDLSQDDVIGFKGARIRIIEADNRKVSYSVISNFPD